jgi:hypothetical protein
MENIWKPTNHLRWYTREVLYEIWKTKLQQLWIDDMGNQEWRDISEE